MQPLELENYIKNELARGLGQSGVKQGLLAAGWPVEQIDKAFNQIVNPQIVPSLGSARILPSSGGHFDAVKIFRRFAGINKKWWLIGIFSAGLFLAAGGAWAYYYYYWTAPERVISKSLISMGEIKTFHLSSAVSTKLNLSGPAKDQLSLLQLPDTTGSANLSIKLDLIQDITNQADGQADGKLWLSLSETEQPMLLGLQYIKKDKADYLQLLDVPNLGFLDLSSLKNQWVKFSQEQLADSPLLSGKIPDYKKVQTISQEQTAKLKPIFIETKPIKFNQRYDSENINGLVSYHYGFVIEPKAMVDFLQQAGPVILGEAYNKEQVDQLKKLDSEYKEPVIGEIWIGKSDYIVRRLRLVIPPPLNNNKSDSMTIVMNLDQINEPVKIAAPSKFLDLNQMLAGFMGGVSTGVTENDLAVNDSDGDGLNDKEEEFYGTGKNNPDTDGDGYKDGDEVKNGYNPLGTGKLTIPKYQTVK
ncbi:MAG: hypothetical protein HY973_01620 [Candidatus Kerfeldbacteria bacterium]|nr:hypothetical protein [Candidatus Kerfeldbacteria bacterium]